MGNAKTEVRVVIADDHPIVRQGLRQVIEADPGLKVVAEAGDGEQALHLIATHQPEVAVLDIDMPKLDGVELARLIREQKLAGAVVFLTIHREEDLFNEALNLGVKGYVLKESAVTDIVACIKAVAAGQLYLSPTLSGYLVNRTTRAAVFTQRKPSLQDLTPTEQRILKLIAGYKSSKDIAEELSISYRTVENHRHNICQKLDIHGSHALMKFALKHQSELA